MNGTRTDSVLGDANVLSAARVEVRKNFESNRHLQTGSEEIQTQIAHANEVAKFLRENVVQGEAHEGDNYSMLCMNINRCTDVNTN